MVNIFDGSGYDKIKIQSLLEESQQAYHSLLTGTHAVTIERNGRKVTYTPAKIQQLRLYIQDLQASLSTSNSRSRTPARMLF